MRKKRALVLSGGGVKGAFQAGFCNYLANIGYKPDFIVGTSVGALNGVFLCQTDNFLSNSDHAIKIWKHYAKNHFFYEFNRNFIIKLGWSESLFSNKHFYHILQTHLKAREFEDLKIPLHVNATHYDSGEGVIFSKGKLISPLVASYSTPPLFPPVNINGAKYIEGTINNISMIKTAKMLGAKEIIYVDLLNNGHYKERSNIVSQVCYLTNLISREINKKEIPFMDKNVLTVNPKFDFSNESNNEKNLSFIMKLVNQYRKITGENATSMIESYLQEGELCAANLHSKGKIRI